MPKSKFRSTAMPPPEVTKVIQETYLHKKYIDGWLAVPSIRPPKSHLGSRKIQSEGVVDAVKLLLPLLESPLLIGSLRTMDVFNGCGHHCDTCLADAAFPSRMFSFESLKRLFKNKRFRRMLAPDSLRFGSSGDILDHPDATKIINMVLWETRGLDKARQKKSKGKKRHVVKVFTNYRPNLEEKLDELIAIARRHKDRFKLVISLPFNTTDVINVRFTNFAVARPEIFGKRKKRHSDKMIVFGWGSTLFENIGVQDVRHPYFLFTSGRVLEKQQIKTKISKWDVLEANRDVNFKHRGLVKTYLNPDALWLMIYVTQYESHTGRVFTPLNPHNLVTFSKLLWHPDFKIPPFWSQDKREYSYWREAETIKKKVKESGHRARRVTVVHK